MSGNPMERSALRLLCLASAALLFSACAGEPSMTPCPEPVGYDEIVIGGELRSRIGQNLERLQAEKYQPENVFLTEEQSGGWPGDTEGRTILGLVCDARALHGQAGRLDEIIALVPAHLNSLGYMGPEYGDVLNEQQLSGNGWMLRGLCAYYDMTSDPKVLDMVRSISENLFVRGKGLYKTYPIDPSMRVSGEGEASGRIMDTSGKWMLSTDTGCLFIGMDGLIDAYRLVGTPDMKEVIEEMLGRFLEVDLVGIQAQTHASLTACRGLVRYAELTGEGSWIDEAEKRWKIYKEYGMTENYENYNWFGRYDSWTEPCAIVDSYILAMKLWQHTRNSDYLRDVQLIYFNALGHTQRANGGFGCDSCPGDAMGPELFVKTDEAHWCCTMRGAEGLATAASYTFLREGDTFYLTCFREGTLDTEGFGMKVGTDYPQEGSLTIEILKNELGGKACLKVFMPGWVIPESLSIGGRDRKARVDRDGFLVLGSSLKEGDRIVLEYGCLEREEATLNAANTRPGQVRHLKGPLILDEGDHPVYHLMDPEVCIGSGYSRKIVFGE